MKTRIDPGTTEQKIEFLQAVLSTEEKRRTSFENKDSILIAANALLSSAIFLHGLPLIDKQNQYTWLYRDLTVISILFFMISLLMIIVSLIRISQKERSKLLDAVDQNRKSENNLFFYEIIADTKKDIYKKKIDELTPDEIVGQLSSQIHNLSRILTRRVKIMNASVIAFILAIISMGVLLLFEIFLGH